MSEPTPNQRGLSHRIASLDTSLLPKILGAFVLVLVGASLVTLLIDTRLTRDALRAPSEDILESQLNVVTTVTDDRLNVLAQNIRVARSGLVIRGRANVREQLSGTVADVAATYGLQVVNAFGESGQLLASASAGDVVEPPPPVVFDRYQDVNGERVVRMTDGRFAHVVVVVIGEAPNRVALVAGFTFDETAALRLGPVLERGKVALLVVDGEVVGANVPPTEDLARYLPPSERSEVEGAEVATVNIDGQQTFVKYETVVPPGDDGWGRFAAVGLAIPEPLAALDQALLRTRVLMILLLIATAAALGWVVTRIVTRPLIDLASTASAIAGGDLDAPFGAPSNDEIGMLAGSLERMRRVLRAQLHVIRRQAALLQDAARRVVAAQDEERRRLARDLHDGVQQQLVMLRLRVGFARARLRSDPDALDDVATDLGVEIDRIIEGLRETSQDIFPSILMDRGLQGALLSLAGRTSIPIDVSAVPDPLPRFDLDLEANAYFLVSEAVTNAIKHARADRITVEARLVDDELRLLVRDDGRGFEVDRTPRSSGLNHLHDRASAVGGSLRIRSSPAEGTTIIASVPVSVPRSLQEEQHGRDTSVQVDLLRESELPEDGVGVLLDRPLGDE